MLGKIEGQEEKGTIEDEMVGWHHRLNGHEFEESLGDSEGQRRLGCYSPWGFPGKNTGVGGHFLLQGIFPTSAGFKSWLHDLGAEPVTLSAKG